MSSPGSQFNIGSDAVVTFLSNGVPFGAMLLTTFQYKQLTTSLTSKPINGDPGYRENEEGWEGTAEFDRSVSTLDDFFVAKEQARFNGQQPPVMTITATINNTDGTTSRYRFEGVAVKLEDGGKYVADEKVTQTMSWRAARRKAA